MVQHQLVDIALALLAQEVPALSFSTPQLLKGLAALSTTQQECTEPA